MGNEKQNANASQRCRAQRTENLYPLTLRGWASLALVLFLSGIFHLLAGRPKRLARYHGRIRPNTGGNWQILAQVASDFMGETCERWIEPADVIETCPADRMRPEIVAIFEKTVNFFG